ncbi:MAG: GTP-binding protein [Acidobacteriota bacterium]
MSANFNGMRRVRLITIGHIDHGKTTLTAAITGLLARKGQARAAYYNDIDAAPLVNIGGAALNLSRVEYNTERRGYEQVDCPKHSDYVSYLTSNSEPVDGAIVVVSAPDGCMPQTREQLELARRNGLEHVIVYLNKCDMVDDDEMLIVVEEEIRVELSRFGYNGDASAIIRGAALKALNGEDDDRGNGQTSIRGLLETLDGVIPDPQG